MRVVYHGSVNLEGAGVDAAATASSLLTVVAVVAITWRARRAGPAALVDATIAVLVAFMTCGKLFSPQFLSWIVPLAVAACARRERRERRVLGWWFLGVLAATQLVFPYGYHRLMTLSPWAAGLVLARNLALAGWAFALLRGTLRRAPCP